MIWLWQVFRWSILASLPRGHCPHHSCCHCDGETRTGDHRSPLRVSCYAHRPKTVTTSFQRGFPLLVWCESPHGSLPPPSLLIFAPLQKCAIFLWRVFELTATGPGMVMLGCSLLSTSPPMAAAQPSAAGRCRLMIGVSVQWSHISHHWSADQLTSWYTLAACSHCSHKSYSWQPWLPVGRNVTLIDVHWWSRYKHVSPLTPVNVKLWLFIKCGDNYTQFNLYHPENCQQTDNRCHEAVTPQVSHLLSE